LPVKQDGKDVQGPLQGRVRRFEKLAGKADIEDHECWPQFDRGHAKDMGGNQAIHQVSVLHQNRGKTMVWRNWQGD
jgi:hypothetical protein